MTITLRVWQSRVDAPLPCDHLATRRHPGLVIVAPVHCQVRLLLGHVTIGVERVGYLLSDRNSRQQSVRRVRISLSLEIVRVRENKTKTLGGEG